MKRNKAAILPFSKLSSFSNQSIFRHSKGPLNPVSEEDHYICVKIDYFSNYTVNVPLPKYNACYAVIAIIHLCISNYSPPRCLSLNRGTDYFIFELAKCCIRCTLRLPPRTAQFRWTNGLVEVQNRNHGTDLRMFQ